MQVFGMHVLWAVLSEVSGMRSQHVSYFLFPTLFPAVDSSARTEKGTFWFTASGTFNNIEGEMSAMSNKQCIN